MSAKRPPAKRARESSGGGGAPARNAELPEVALAAIASYRKQKEVSDFINFILETLERNSKWLNNIVGKQTNFRCALMSGAGPNRFQIQEIVYPSADDDIKLEVQLNDSEDYDKIALTALLRLSTTDMENLSKYMKTRMCDNPMLKEDLLKGKAMGISFAFLRPISENQYRVMERIVLGNSSTNTLTLKKSEEPCKKRRREDKSLAETFLRRAKRAT